MATDDASLSPDDLLREAWKAELADTWARKRSTDPALIPCSECGAEVGWEEDHCRACGFVFDPGERRYRARLYESLLWGEEGCSSS